VNARYIADVESTVAGCATCPRLVAWRQEAATTKRRAYAGEEYWGRGVPGNGDPGARILIVGLAPGAHGANRTGRPFTGDISGRRLHLALHRAGLADPDRAGLADPDPRATAGAVHQLLGCYLTNVVKCAPPGNRPTAGEVRACRAHLVSEVGALPDLRVVVALGGQAWRGVASVFGLDPVPAFGPDLGREWSLRGGGGGDRAITVLQSWHTSPLSWNAAGRGSAPKLDAVLARAVALAAR
jgi:uracil-DNA glycosylase